MHESIPCRVSKMDARHIVTNKANAPSGLHSIPTLFMNNSSPHQFHSTFGFFRRDVKGYIKSQEMPTSRSLYPGK